MSDKKFSKERVKELLAEQSFKRKPMMIELFNYHFSHKPMEKYEDGFIGRRNLIKRLRNFINDSSSASGAYLVTGFRGVGKTSLVNKALEIFEEKKYLPRFFLLAVTSIVTIFFIDNPDTDTSKRCIIIAATVASCLVLLYFFFKDNLTNLSIRKKKKKECKKESLANLKGKRGCVKIWSKITFGFQRGITSQFKLIKQRLQRTIFYSMATLLWVLFLLFIFHITGSSGTHDKVVQSACAIIFVYALFGLAKRLHTIHSQNIWPRIKKGLPRFIFGFTLFAIVVIVILKIFNVSLPFKWKGWSPLFLLLAILYFIIDIVIPLIFKNWRHYIPLLSDYLSFHKVLIVRVNLGKDKLTEIDLLKYTVTNLLNEYEIWRRKLGNIVTTSKIILPYIILFFAFVFIQHQKPFDEILDRINKDYEIYTYLPSQTLLLVDNKDGSLNNSIRSEFENFMKKEGSKGYIDKMNDIIDRYNKKIKSENDKKAKLQKGKKAKPEEDKKRDTQSQDTISPIPNEHGKLTIKNIFIGIDLVVSVVYYKIRKALIGEGDHGSLDRYYPIAIDYSAILGLFLIWLIFSKLNLLALFGVATHRGVVKDLRRLKERIDAAISIENKKEVSVNGGGIFGGFLNKNKSLLLSPMDVKDIETELILILKKMSMISSVFVEVLPIFVYDELDKISPDINYSIQMKEDEKNSSDTPYKNKRQENIISILSSLKAYFSSSQAKFIFIAGRDMFDAALAEVSDRHSILNSIFHDNYIYVPSFYSELDDWAINDITSLTEHFVCQYLMPKERYRKTGYASLRQYNEYLKEKDIAPEVREQVILAINNLITFISYRGNGIPKKMVSIFESFLEEGTWESLRNEYDDIIVISNSYEKLHLKLSYYSQYRTSYISYLVTPIFFKLGSHVKELSDKILVSTNYLVDHIFKYHSQAFSTENLSLTPEIIDISKEPEFRPFLRSLLADLSVTHLRRIISGLFEFRFQSKVFYELKFMTLFPEESAAFNFTLDESIKSKRHFNKLLSKIKKQYAGYINSDPENKVIDSIIFYHSVLGDLHFYDQEYQDAIINYSEALQFMHQIPMDDMSDNKFILLLKLTLKLSLSYEKEGSYKDALLLLFDLSRKVIVRRAIDLDYFGLNYFLLKADDFDDHFYPAHIEKNTDIKVRYLERANAEGEKKNSGEVNGEKGDEGKKNNGEANIERERIKEIFFKKGTLRECIIVGRRKINSEPQEVTTLKWIGREGETIVYPEKQLDVFYGLKGETLEIREQIPEAFYKQVFSIKLSTFEHLRILYQPIIARLHLLEKSSLNGVRTKDIERSLAEFENLKKIFSSSETNLIVAEFYNKIGDILFYKNISIKLSDDDKPTDALDFYIKSYNSLVPEENKIERNNLTKFGELKNLNQENNSFFFSTMANSIIDIADAWLALGLKQGNNENSDPQFEEAKKLYLEAAGLFEKIGEYRLAKSQYIKIIFLCILSLPDKKDANTGKNQNSTSNEKENTISIEEAVKKSIDLINLTYKASTIAEKWKYADIFGDIDENTTGVADDPKRWEKFSCLQNEIREIRILYYLYKLKKNQDQDKISDLAKEIYAYLNDSPAIPSRYVRLLEATLRVNLNKKVYNCIKSKDELTGMFCPPHAGGNKEVEASIKLFLIIDSIGTLTEAIKIHELLGINYVFTGYLSLAKVHGKRYFWSKELEAYKKDKDEWEEVRSLLSRTLNTKKLRFLDPDYNKEKCVFYNKKIKEINHGGNAYRNFISSKFYLDDDFNDNIVHFGLAKERFLTNGKGTSNSNPCCDESATKGKLTKGFSAPPNMESYQNSDGESK